MQGIFGHGVGGFEVHLMAEVGREKMGRVSEKVIQNLEGNY